ncbi:PulJ/GspJ family protein [Achromobacter xylosoxidans]
MTGQRQAGFTLIEVVIAIMIMAIISLISWRAIDSVALTSRRLDQHTEEALALQRAFDQFERDIGARSPDLAESAAPAAPEAQAASDAQEAEPQPVLPQLLPEALRVSGMKTPAPRIDIIRGAPGRPDARQRVVWERRGGNLIRAAGTPTALTPLPAPAADAATVVLDQLLDFSVRAWAPGRGWVALPAQGEQPAQALELVISRGVLGQTPLRYRRVLLLH